MPKAQKLRVAVIGAGNMGRNHLRNYYMLPDTELVGLADINPLTKELADEYKTQHYIDYKTLFDELKPDAVSIVVPTPFHAAVAAEAMNRGIHVLVEKPITSTVQEADELIALAKKKGVVFTVGHIEHYNPLITTLKKLLDDGLVGDITSVVCKRVGGFPAAEPKTDVIIDLAVHDIDIISHLLGSQPKQIYSHASRTHHSREVDSAEILLDYGNASGFVQANWLTPVKIRTIAVTGSRGYIEGNYITQQLEYYKHNMEKTQDGFSNFVIKMGEPEKEIIKVDFQEPLALELKSFISRVNGDDEAYLVDPTAAKHALHQALEALKPYKNKEV
jgi:UDP-N-acetylglucosamine 3-dehydrogenase